LVSPDGGAGIHGVEMHLAKEGVVTGFDARESRKAPAALWRGAVLAFALAGLLAVISVCASMLLSPPKFLISRSGQSLEPRHYPLLQAWGDWVRGRKYLLLTFDDGPFGSGVDDRILDVLEKHHARAVFFVVCRNLARANEMLLQREIADGDLIGNHSFDHAHLMKLPDDQLLHEIAGCNDLVAERTGRRPAFFRPPFGQTSARVRALEQSSGLREMLWDANSEDSWLTRPEQIMAWSMRESDNFSILLMHSKPTTAAVLDQVLSGLEGRGFRFVLPVTHFSSRSPQPQPGS